ncbi:uncharacterized protein BDZ99DRAFT_493615 [Mytilinidion resinicola]|uniref:Uncharacterized protein n=1 Tax=Mytilinidion resinicola TaxID=574789 RepID=A0A6A6Z463_9PEZI|nr:uncharacterized protein BDZ99DRAFT_493615 [Mytilinidion resinicola]KAF2815608.1 hypothetical protein BDZ99DRAFT_493615 [Mytilinidion resinicola]
MTALQIFDYESLRTPKEIIGLLDEIIEHLDEVLSIAKGEQPNRTAFLTPHDETWISGDDGHTNSTLLQDQQISEIDELLETVADSISGLFRISMLIRKATPRDRFQKAATAATEPFDDLYDIAHVAHKFPKLEEENMKWLKVRLGRAITRRRQFLRYARDHHKRPSHAPKTLPNAGREDQRELLVRELDRQAGTRILALDTRSEAISSLPQTTASTLAPLILESIQGDIEDGRSQTSFATSVADDTEESKLRVVPLKDVAGGKVPFECPYC